MAILHVAIRDHRRLVREGLCLLLNDENGIEALEFGAGDASTPQVIILANEQERYLDSQNRTDGARVVTFDDASRIEDIVAALYGDERPLLIEAAPADAPVESAPETSCTLTAREAEILTCIAGGLSAGEVSIRLGISRKTVESHKRRIFAKLNVQNQAHAVAIATRMGLLDQRS